MHTTHKDYHSEKGGSRHFDRYRTNIGTPEEERGLRITLRKEGAWLPRHEGSYVKMLSASFRRYLHTGDRQGQAKNVTFYIQVAVLSVGFAILVSSVGLLYGVKKPNFWLYTYTRPVHLVPLAVASDYTLSPVSYVQGKAFNRFVTIWLENTDYNKAAGDPNIEFFAKKGITLNNYFAVTHPSEPNYVAAVSGDYYGINNDDDNIIPANVSTVVDLLEEKGISWGEYQEYMPYTGFTGKSYKEEKTRKNRYVKKHNPLIMHASVADFPDRRACIKNFTLFYEDLKSNKLPQWLFITPDQQNNGHDTSVTYAGKWLRGFLEPLLDDPNFINNTLVLVTFDENDTYSKQNRVFSILLGDVIPKNLIGSADKGFYNHYSELSTVQANWGLKSLGRYDVGANVFDLVAQKTGDSLRSLDITKVYLNESYPGIFHRKKYAPLPVPDTEASFAGKTVLESIRNIWGKVQNKSVYKGAPLSIPSLRNPPIYPREYSRRKGRGGN
ncbi:hypothetical protein EYR41_004366 [Orbilia oligospora]|uniref:Uncharacterized protein n=1 Tax=Orbilia oligospora TaxID=2813651 RepID=A0A7C8PM60_ORBOL|nr:hypothetical protein TWF751_005090 [Orbilia oligospora]TGJ72476.1 hypothetical protein EYR41_004366 [Orbilia oligospora]